MGFNEIRGYKEVRGFPSRMFDAITRVLCELTKVVGKLIS